MVESFQCIGKQCLNSCCGEYEGLSSIFYSVDNRPFTDIILTDDDVRKIINTEYESYIYLANDGIYRVRTDKNGYCSAFIEGVCKLQDCKPSVCKCYPLYLDVMVGICAHKACSAANPNYDLSNYEREFEALLSVCEFWISHYRKRV